ncbi:MAG: S41 family peptidase, partial [Woeseia sp.]
MLLALAACGGGGGSGGGSSGGIGPGIGSWVQGVFEPASNFQSLCVNPRSGINPATGRAYADRSGTRTDENNFLRSYSFDTYLWYREIVDRNPALYSTPEYFEGLKTSATTTSGTDKDQYHFSQDTAEWFAQSQTGAGVGYGVQWALLSRSPPRQLLVAYSDPNTPASAAGLSRGTEVLTIDGVDVANGTDVDALNSGLSPASAGETHQFQVRDPDGTLRNISLTAQTVTSTPVQNVHSVTTSSGNVGYMQFNDHIAPAEQGLIDAITQLANDNVTDLVIDLRYNGGGFLYIASELGYMIAGNP